MLFAVLVEVDAMNGTACFTCSATHTLRTVSKGQDADTGTADGAVGCQQIHIAVGDAFGSNGAFLPMIENAVLPLMLAEHPDGFAGSMVDVCKRC